MREMEGSKIHELIGGAQAPATPACEELRGTNSERNSLGTRTDVISRIHTQSKSWRFGGLI